MTDPVGTIPMDELLPELDLAIREYNLRMFRSTTEPSWDD